MKTLAHNDTVRIQGSQPHHMIKIGTETGFAAGRWPVLMDESPWTTRACDVLHSGSKESKLAEFEREHKAFEAAPLLENGELVAIEGKTYKVIVNGPQYADPITFRKEG